MLEATMALDLEELKFCGLLAEVAQEELSASMTEDPDLVFRKELYKQYVDAGKPKNKKEWVRQELRKHFVSVKESPKWIERTTIPTWPFSQGKPMVFIQQITVPESQDTKTKIRTGCVLYVFGSKKSIPDVPGGWDMEYRVIEQVHGL
jgi:hypothetical protein